MMTWRIFTRIAVITAAGLLLANCAGSMLSSGSSDAAQSAQAAGLAGEAPLQELRLAPGDKVRVTVYGEDKISGDYQIDTGGEISLPLAGTVRAAGLTKKDLELLLARQFKGEYLRNPKVTVDVISYRPFFVLGEVQKPGEYQFRSDLNVLSAIAIAGGGTYRASKSTVLIQRSGTTEIREYPLSPSVKVLPGDLIRVPERYF